MEDGNSINPRVLILESDRGTCAAVRRYVVKTWHGASVQSVSAPLASVVGNSDKLKSFDAIIVGCDFSKNGTTDAPTLRALRAIAADPHNPPVILLTEGGSEYTAVQAMKAGAFDYITKTLLGRDSLISAVKKALLSRNASNAGDMTGVLQLFGYDVRHRLSSHGSVSVHVAYSAEHGEEVVLKVLHREPGSLARDVNFERFIGEFKLLHDIDDAAVARIYDFRATSQYSYMAMEYFAEGHLGRKLAGPLDPQQALATTIEIAHALAIIHAAGVVHRDLKPANIMLRKNGTVALIDFGISQSSRADRPAANEDTELISGTPYYMSPEQARGEVTGERTDLYALGVILYQMLTGAKPYVGEKRDDILAQHINAPVPQLPPPNAHYQPLIDRLLAKIPDQRLSSAREAIELIERLRSTAPVLDYLLTATTA